MKILSPKTMLTKAFLVISLLFTTLAFAAPFSVTDIAGREVKFDKLPKRIILGSGRLMYPIAAATAGNPFKKIVGWDDNLIKYDPDAYKQFQKAFPEDTKRLLNVGNVLSGDFSVETIINEKADLMILDISRLFVAEETGLLEKLEKVNIPVIFVDFRKQQVQNTVPSILLLGRVLGEEKSTTEFLDFYMRELGKVTNVVEQMSNEDRPLVFLERAAGWSDNCCKTFGSYNYGRYIELAGGINYGSTQFSGYESGVSLEGVIAANPKHIVATGAQWENAVPGTKAVLLGYNADKADNKKRLDALMARNGFKDLDAVKNGNYHAIYHPWYDGPFYFVAVQQIAKWLHPEEFEDLDPQATLDELHKRFLDYDDNGQFWISAEAKQ